MTWRAGAAAALLGLGPLVAGCTASTPPTDVTAQRKLPVPLPATATPLPPYSTAAPVPAPAVLARVLAPALADSGLGPGAGLRVVDVASGVVLVDHLAQTPVPPASTAKLLTAVAALQVLGPQHRLTTATVRVGDAVVLVGGGDPTLAGPRSVPHYPPAARLADLAAQTARALGPGARVRVAVDDSLFTGPRLGLGWKPNYVPDGDVAPVSALELDGARLAPDDNPKTPDLRAADPALHAGRALAALLRRRGVDVVGSVVRQRAPAGARPLAAVRSAPLSELVEGMLARSDNDLAEALARELAIAAGKPATFSAGAAAVLAAVGALGVRGPLLHDGSGLSPLDRVTPTQLAAVIALAADPRHGQLSAVISGLPVAGFSGTLSDRFASAPAARGVVRAKTGTLSGVSTLAGLVVTADGRLLAFAATAPHAPGTKRAQLALDRLLGLLAGCGCR